jgi:tRNA (guanosine-2'-O-)-methyltransferase
VEKTPGKLMMASDAIALMAYLESFVTPQRLARIDAVLAHRTRHLTVVAEDFHDPHNASALLRTCDALGIQDVHVVEKHNTFKARVGAASGAIKWVTQHQYSEQPNQDNTLACCEKLRSQGYLIVATSPHLSAVPPEAIPLDQKLAVIFGSERHGVSQEAIAAADYQLKIPMVGFVESLNVSVSAAVCLYTMTQRLRSLGIVWSLSDREKQTLRLDWIRQSVQNSAALERRYWQDTAST